MSLWRCKREHTPRQIAKWIRYINDLENEESIDRAYLLRIYGELVRTRTKKNIKDSDLKLKRVAVKPHAKMSRDEQKKLADQNKHYLHQALGLVNEDGTTDPSG